MKPAPPENTRPVPARHAFDTAALRRWMDAHVAPTRGELRVRQFRGGQSNPTFWVADDAQEHVLRKKPPGRLLPSAHQVEREYRVLAAL